MFNYISDIHVLVFIVDNSFRLMSPRAQIFWMIHDGVIPSTQLQSTTSSSAGLEKNADDRARLSLVRPRCRQILQTQVGHRNMYATLEK
jgi:hypothetical protein